MHKSITDIKVLGNHVTKAKLKIYVVTLYIKGTVSRKHLSIYDIQEESAESTSKIIIRGSEGPVRSMFRWGRVVSSLVIHSR